MARHAIVSTGDRPDLNNSRALAPLRDGWPRFVLHDRVSNDYRAAVSEFFPDFDVLLVEDSEVLGRAVAVTLAWDGHTATLPDGYDGAIVTAVNGHQAAVNPDTLCVVSATVRTDRTGGGLAAALLTALRQRAQRAGLLRMIVPVRPILKANHPLTSMAEFMQWTRTDGLHPDPWIRTHQRLGAAIVAPAPRSMSVSGTVAQWEDWTNMRFEHSGRYTVPGGLDPVEINRERDHGTYTETNLWMRHQ
ncbi:hypothetical protein ABZ412_27820 [Nocardia sp. NPDC005746]|uniref:hypothetical protein n=1 Tax=Nocardia sp. NPDC005746 TaxID=3157062 RepID=UPI003403C411